MSGLVYIAFMRTIYRIDLAHHYARVRAAANENEVAA
jgi:hypothetical protein